MAGKERRLSGLNNLAQEGFLRVGTSAVIVDSSGRYLLVKETTTDCLTGKKPGCWSLPSDKAKVGENFLMTLIRGLEHELPGIAEHLFLTKGCFLGEAAGSLVCARLVLLYYEGAPDQQFSSEEAAEARWFEPGEICAGDKDIVFRSGMRELFLAMERILPAKGIRTGKKLAAVAQNLKAVSLEAPDIDLAKKT